jgi:hypothetical protein
MILTVLLLSFMTTAQQPSPLPANNFGIIKGVVVDQDGKPVAGANVYVAGIRWPAEGHNDPPLNSRSNETTSDAKGEFVLDRVVPSKSVIIHAYTDTDYYAFVLWAFNLPAELERPEVEVKPGQTVTGITVRLTQRAGQLRVYVRDAKTGEMVNGVFSQLCREDHPTYCAMNSGPGTTPVPVGVGISIKIKTDDGRRVKWEYHNPKTGSPFFRANSGETETMNVYLPDANDFGVIEGTVVDPSGKPVDGAVVHESSNDGRPVEGALFRTSTTTDVAGNFVLDHVIPAEKVDIWAYKYSDYYEDVMEPFTFDRPQNLKIPEVEVKPGQTVAGVRIQFAQKAGKLHLYVRDADSKDLVHGVFIQWCRKGYAQKYCINGSAPSDYERLISLGVGISIKIEADDGQHQKWEYRDAKTGSPYFRAKSGETETINIYLRKKK